MAWLPRGEKKFEDIFIRFGATHERDRRTDRRTPRAGNSRAMHIIARQKQVIPAGTWLIIMDQINFAKFYCN